MEEGQELSLIQLLPNEVLAVIIEHAGKSMTDLLGLKLVCHRWSEVVDTTKKILVFEYDHLSTTNIGTLPYILTQQSASLLSLQKHFTLSLPAPKPSFLFPAPPPDILVTSLSFHSGPKSNNSNKKVGRGGKRSQKRRPDQECQTGSGETTRGKKAKEEARGIMVRRDAHRKEENHLRRLRASEFGTNSSFLT